MATRGIIPQLRVAPWGVLAVALREHARYNEVSRVTQTGFGPRYEVHGPLAAPDGRSPLVCAVWQMDEGKAVPRLITAYPLEDDA